MTVNRKVTGNAMSIGGGIGLGVAFSMLVTLIGAMLLAWMISKEIVPQAAVGYGAMVILMLSTVAGAWLSAHKIGHRKLVVCVFTGAGYYLALLAVTALLFGGQYRGMGVTGLVILCGVGITALGTSRSQGIKKSKIKKMRYS